MKIFGRRSAVEQQDAAANYSLVTDDRGAICGIWLRDKRDAKRPGLIEALLAKHNAIELIGQPREVVSNRSDGAGGCFVMFGGVRAPGS